MKQRVYRKFKCGVCGKETELMYISYSKESATGVVDNPRCTKCLAHELADRLKDVIGEEQYRSPFFHVIDSVLPPSNCLNIKLERLTVEVRRTFCFPTDGVTTPGDTWAVRCHNPISEVSEIWTYPADTIAEAMEWLVTGFDRIFRRDENGQWVLNSYPRRLTDDDDD